MVARATMVPVERSTALSMKVSSPPWRARVSPGRRMSAATFPAARALWIATRSVSLGLN
jgi:hypothetical protein